MARTTADIVDVRRQLRKFSTDSWTRASWVLLKNPQVQPWVDAGYLEARPDPTWTGYGACPTEYRLTDAGTRFLNATKEKS